VDFHFSEEQTMLRELAREILEKELDLERLKEVEAEGDWFDRELWAKLAEANLLGLAVPEAQGGMGMGFLELCVLLQEIGRAVAPLPALPALVCGGLAIARFGSDAQKQRWLPGIAKGEVICSACLTEPGGGTDLGNLKTVARVVDGGYELTGTKVFISHAEHAGLFFVVASIDLARKHKGVCAFLLDPKQTRGITIRDFPMRTLKRDNLAEVHFEGAFVPTECLLGEEGAGFPILGSALDMGRFSVAARQVGQAQRAIDLALPYANERRAFDQPIGHFQLTQQKITDMISRCQQARHVVYQLGRMKDAGIERCSMESSMAKLLASKAAVANALDGMQIFGGYSCSAEYEIGRLLMEAKAMEFGEGTSELHTKIIAEIALGLRKG